MRIRLLCLVLSAITCGAAVVAQTPVSWPSFRGANAAGVATGQNLPATWDAVAGTSLRWKVEIPGLAHSSPIVYDTRLFLTTAISGLGNATFKPGLYGEGTASEDRSVHKWVVMAIDRRNGRTLWERVAYSGPPRQKRHIKSTYASSTPATDGRYVVALFGSQGLYAYDMSGKLMWQRDLGRMDVGAYDLPDYEWGTASSPIIYKDLAIVQCDQQKGSFIEAFDLKTGVSVWKTMREELPSWGTPTVYQPAKRPIGPELVTNASNFIRGYDPATGKELWRLGGSSKITAPTPVFTDDYILIASGRRDEKPIFVIKPGARGDITLAAGSTSSAVVVWSKRGRGPYMPTPIIHDTIAYVLGNDGIFDTYDLASGAEVYRQRIPHKGSGFSASPVIADGRIILSSEDGDMFVVPVGRTFSVAPANPMGEALMATPAIAGGTLYVRGEKHLFAIGR